MFQPFIHRQITPGEIFFNHRLAITLVFRGQLKELIGSLAVAVEDNVLYRITQFGWNFIVHFQLTGIDNGHIQPSADGVI